MTIRTNNVSTTLIILLIATAVVANEELIDYRQDSMEAIEIHFKSIKKILEEDVPFKSHLSMHVSALVDYSEIMPDLFAEGSEGGDALDEIWDDEDLYESSRLIKMMGLFKGAVNELKNRVEEDDSDAILKAFEGVGNSCRGCHRRYRE